MTEIIELFDNNHPTPLLKMWREEDEERLQKLKNPEIEMADTAVARKQALMKQQVMASRIDLSDDEWNQIVELWKRKWGGI